FHEVLRFYERRSLPPPLRHAANSGAIVQLRESHLDLVRPGILFYGARPAAEVPAVIPVRQALSWVTRVVCFRVVKAGHPACAGPLQHEALTSINTRVPRVYRGGTS